MVGVGGSGGSRSDPPAERPVNEGRMAEILQEVQMAMEGSLNTGDSIREGHGGAGEVSTGGDGDSQGENWHTPVNMGRTPNVDRDGPPTATGTPATGGSVVVPGGPGIGDPVIESTGGDGGSSGTTGGSGPGSGFSIVDLNPLETVVASVLTGSLSGNRGLASGSLGGDGGDVPAEGGDVELDRRDPSKGKGVMTEEEQPYPEIDLADVVIRLVVGSSRATPTVWDDFAEPIGEANLARLQEIDPMLTAEIHRFREKRLRQITVSDEAARVEREQEREHAEEMREMEEEEMIGPQLPAVEVTRRWVRPVFDVATYALPEPHLIIPSGFDRYRPRSAQYDPDLVQ